MKRALLVFAIACHTPTPTPTPTPNPSPSQSQSPTPLPTPTPSPSQPPPPVTIADAGSAPAFIDDLAAWIRSHGATPPANVDFWGSCYPMRLGTSDAIACRGAPMESLKTGESVFPLRVVAIRSGKLETALLVPIVAGPLDNLVEPGENADDNQYVILDWSFDAAGTTLTIADKPSRTCAQALAEYKSGEWAGHRRMTDKACASRGKYTLQNGKLVRTP